jgi:hypothetical protein
MYNKYYPSVAFLPSVVSAALKRRHSREGSARRGKLLVKLGNLGSLEKLGVSLAVEL